MITLVDDDQSDLYLDTELIAPIVEQVLAHFEEHAEELSVRFVSEPEMCQLHDQYLGDPSPTDCMSFPMDEEGEYRVLGDIVISPSAALAYPDPYEEVTLYLVHGILHLIGYDDVDPSDRAKMREAESSVMGRLHSANLILRAKS
jgi:probable rRNA maturation factor